MNDAPAKTSLGPGVRLHNLTLGYGTRAAVHHLDGMFAPGSLTAVIGPNGSGKSTLIKGIAGLLRPIEGRIELTGKGRRELSYLPQSAQIDRGFPLRVDELASLGQWSRIGAFAGLGGEHRHAVGRALEAVGIGGFAKRQIGALSGGQLQRVLFARVLVEDQPLILLDEPFTAIDMRTAADLMAIVERWHREGRTVIAVMHDIELARQRFPEALLLAREPIAWGRAGDVLTEAHIKDANRRAEQWSDETLACERNSP